jgi:integrase
MPRVRQNEAKTVRHTSRDGSVVAYHYDRETGARLPAAPPRPRLAAGHPPVAADPADPLAYQRVVLGLAGADVALGELFRAWRYSSHFGELSPKTQRNYAAVMRHPAIAPLLAVPCRAVTPRSLRMLRDGVAEAGRAARGRPTKGMANLMLAVLGAAFSWGVENFDLEQNPARGLKRLRIVDGGHAPWSDEAVAAWLASAPEWSRRLIQLGLWTALRAADLIALRWDAWDGRAIRITPAKTRRSSAATLYLPLSPQANALLAQWRAEPTVGVTILTQSRGRPWGDSNYLAQQMRRTQIALGLPAGTTHGLRCTAATRLIEAGVSPRDVMALTGHTQEGSFAKYVRHADQRQRAERAAAVWATVTPLRRRS